MSVQLHVVYSYQLCFPRTSVHIGRFHGSWFMSSAKVQCQCLVPKQEVLCPLCNDVERMGVDVELVDDILSLAIRLGWPIALQTALIKPRCHSG